MKNNFIRFIDEKIFLPGASSLRLIIRETTTRISFLKKNINVRLIYFIK